MRRLPKTWPVWLLVAVTAGSGAGAAPAAAPAADAKAPPAAEEQTDRPARDGDEDAPADAKAAEVFVPTEEISEDYAVSFPVDI